MLRAAVYSGADCVYAGVQGFNARRPAANFGGADLAGAVAFAHARGCGVYAALNTLVLPGEEKKLDEAIAMVAMAGCDAVIVQDIGVARRVRQLAPGLPLHASTQMSVHSPAGVQTLAELGFSRAILARELSEEEIAEIAAVSPIELEVFVHGALCVCLSGQCWMSAFLGGRSANRGMCAGPCRLPFAAARGAVPEKAAAGEKYHLSLKDLSVLSALPRLQAMGVAAAKIEGRLRGPEYCAAVVNAARKARAGEAYDEAFLRDVYSRSGFTDGWFTGKGGRAMFGVRTPGDSAATRAALPKARELYRREMPRVPVSIRLALSAEGAAILVSDGENSIEETLACHLQNTRQDDAAALARVLEKTGGTPFYAEDVKVETGGYYLPAGEASALRTRMLEQLLALRTQPKPRPLQTPPAAAVIKKEKGNAARAALPRLHARFEKLASLPDEAANACEELILPLWEMEEVPPALRPKTRLWLPRALFGADEEKRTASQMKKALALGFSGFEAGNLGHFSLLNGAPFSGGFTLNITNAASLQAAAALGCQSVCLSPELSLRKAEELAGAAPAGKKLPLALPAYGHLPLMLTRACPLHHTGGCTACPEKGSLTDRKGMQFPVTCSGGTRGVRSIYNPVPLWMADSLNGWPADIALLYFTAENAEQSAAVIRAFQNGEAAPQAFTRGLYRKGLAAGSV